MTLFKKENDLTEFKNQVNACTDLEQLQAYKWQLERQEEKPSLLTRITLTLTVLSVFSSIIISNTSLYIAANGALPKKLIGQIKKGLNENLYACTSAICCLIVILIIVTGILYYNWKKELEQYNEKVQTVTQKELQLLKNNN